MYIRIPTLKLMNRLAIEFIFNRDGMSDDQKRTLSEGIDQWKRKRFALQEEMIEIDRIVEAIVRDSQGKLKALKDDIKRHGLDYRRLFKDGV